MQTLDFPAALVIFHRARRVAGGDAECVGSLRSIQFKKLRGGASGAEHAAHLGPVPSELERCLMYGADAGCLGLIARDHGGYKVTSADMAVLGECQGGGDHAHPRVTAMEMAVVEFTAMAEGGVRIGRVGHGSLETVTHHRGLGCTTHGVHQV